MCKRESHKCRDGGAVFMSLLLRQMPKRPEIVILRGLFFYIQNGGKCGSGRILTVYSTSTIMLFKMKDYSGKASNK